MVFSSPIFLFLFLPIVLGVYYAVPWRLKNHVLMHGSLIFYFLGERFYTVVLLVVIAINYVIGIMLDRNDPFQRKVVIAIGIALNLAGLVYFKYANFFLGIFQDVFSFTGISLPTPSPIHLPIGISFFTFQALSYIIDAYRGEVKIQRDLGHLALYKSLFPQLIAGPIVRYAHVENDLDHRTHSWTDFAYGVERFVFGLAKKLLIANQVAYYVDKIFAIPDQQLSTSLVWLGIIGYALQIYFDFSAYSDMAIGLARMFGFKFMENFNYPYISLSIQEFWRRWHISLSTWFRDYLYIPLGGSRLGTFKTYRNLLIVFFLTGLWHGASYNFIIWGLLHGSFLILERTGFNSVLDRIPKLLRSVYVIFIVLIGWVFFRASDLSQAFGFLKKMFVFEGNAQGDAHFLFLVDANFIVALIAGIVLATPIRPFLFKDCFYNNTQRSGIKLVIYNVIIVVTFALSVIYLAAGTYNPFIYFRF